VEGIDEFERPEASFLDHVLGIALVAREPVGQIVGRIQMSHENFLEPF